MKKHLSMTSAGLMMALAFTSCKKDEVTEMAPVAVAKQMTQNERIITYLFENGHMKNGNGATFVIPEATSASFGIFRDIVFDPIAMEVVSGQVGGFSAEYGANDFWRENPDGTVSMHIVSNQAMADYTDFGTGETYLGTGNCNFNYTSSWQTLELPFPPFQLTMLMLDPDQNAFSIHGQSNVTLNGEPGQKHKLRMKWLMNPGGQGGASIELN